MISDFSILYSTYWSWDKADGDPPKKFQFHLAVVKEVPNGLDDYWVNVLSPVISFDSSVPYLEPLLSENRTRKCYAKTLTQNKVFKVLSNEPEIQINCPYIKTLFRQHGKMFRKDVQLNIFVIMYRPFYI